MKECPHGLGELWRLTGIGKGVEDISSRQGLYVLAIFLKAFG